MMNMYKQTIYISLIVSIISLLLALLFWHQETRWGDFFSNVCIGIFCSICIVVITVYIQYKSEFKRLYSNEATLLRELYIKLLLLMDTDVSNMNVNMRIDLMEKIENCFSSLIHNASEMSFIERKYKKEISAITKDILKMYMPFLDNYRMYPAVSLQLLKKPEYIEIVRDDLMVVSKNKSDKVVLNIFSNKEMKKAEIKSI